MCLKVEVKSPLSALCIAGYFNVHEFNTVPTTNQHICHFFLLHNDLEVNPYKCNMCIHVRFNKAFFEIGNIETNQKLCHKNRKKDCIFCPDFNQ